MKTFERICWIGTCLMALAASLRMSLLWQTNGLSAPQYAAEACGIMIMVIVPYVFSRAIRAIRTIQ